MQRRSHGAVALGILGTSLAAFTAAAPSDRLSAFQVVYNGRGRAAYWRYEAGWRELRVADESLQSSRLLFRSVEEAGAEAPGRTLEFSPDGAYLAFRGSTGGFGAGNRFSVYVARADGTGLKSLTPLAQDELDPAWSPDGKWLACLRRVDDARAELWVMRPDGGERRRVSTTVALRDAEAETALVTWAPDLSAVRVASAEFRMASAR